MDQPGAAYALMGACQRDTWHRLADAGGFTMLVGVPKEIRNREFRVGFVPTPVHELRRAIGAS